MVVVMNKYGQACTRVQLSEEHVQQPACRLAHCLYLFNVCIWEVECIK